MARPLAASLALVALTTVAGRAAQAEPISVPVMAMIDAVADDPAKLEIIAAVAKRTNPQSAAEIDAKLAFIRDDAEKRRVARLGSYTFRQGWTGQGEAGGSLITGNTEESGATLGLNLAKETLLRRDRITATADQKTSSNVETVKRYFAGYQSDYKFGERLYANLLASWEKDPFAGLDTRFSESAGVGYRLLQGGSTTLDAEIGLAARQTRYTATAAIRTDDTDTVGLRTASHYEWRFRPGATLTQVASAYVDDQSDTIESATAVTTRLIGALSWRGSFNVKYESNPPPPLQSTDTVTRFSLVYGF